MQDIADRAQLARCTVSRALRNHPAVTKETRERVHAIARQLGYRPNPLVTALMSRVRKALPKETQPIIAYLTAFPQRYGWKAYFSLSEFFEGALRRCETNGFRLEHFWLGDVDMNWTRMGEILHARGIPGIILAPLPYPYPEPLLPWEHFAVAALGHTTRAIPSHRATNNQFFSLQIALERLTALGYRRVGLVLHNVEDIRVMHNFRGAFSVYQSKLKPQEKVKPHLPLRLNKDDFLAWYLREMPDVILALEPKIKIWLKEAGLRIPTDVAYAFLATHPGSSNAGMDPQSQHVAAAAVDLVVSQLHRNEFGLPQTPKTVSIDGVWVDGATAPLKHSVPRSGNLLRTG